MLLVLDVIGVNGCYWCWMLLVFMLLVLRVIGVGCYWCWCYWVGVIGVGCYWCWVLLVLDVIGVGCWC